MSRLNDDQLFYFQSRGIKKEIAEEMLAIAFVEEVAFSIEDEVIRNQFTNAIESRWKEG